VTTLRLATPADDALLRQLLRENGMPSWVEMAMEREPSYFAAHGMHPYEWAVLAHDGDAVVGMYSAALARVHVDGEPRTIGYLGGLRVQAPHRQRIRHLRRGYASIRTLAPAAADLPWWLTVVAEENRSARRLLEAGVNGLPRYKRLGSMCTYALARARGRRGTSWRQASEADAAALVDFHARQAAAFQLAPVLSHELVLHVGITRFWIHERAGGFAAMAALWDQSATKQVVARGYHPMVRAMRSLYNAFAGLAGRVTLPALGEPLAQSFIAFAAFESALLARERESLSLLRELLSLCPTPVAAIGLHESHPLGTVLAQLAPLRYRTAVYAVEFDSPAALDARPVQPEVALL
jgi:hypothetical protein